MATGFVADYINEALNSLDGDGEVPPSERDRDRELVRAQVQASLAVAVAIEHLTEAVREQGPWS